MTQSESLQLRELKKTQMYTEKLFGGGFTLDHFSLRNG